MFLSTEVNSHNLKSSPRANHSLLHPIEIQLREMENHDNHSPHHSLAQTPEQPSPSGRLYRLPAEDSQRLGHHELYRSYPITNCLPRTACADFSYAGVGGWIRRKPHLDPMVRQSVYTSSSHLGASDANSNPRSFCSNVGSS